LEKVSPPASETHTKIVLEALGSRVPLKTGSWKVFIKTISVLRKYSTDRETVERVLPDGNGKQQYSIVIRRAILESYERFTAFLLEQTKGKFPLWPAPFRTSLLSLSEKFASYANNAQKELIDKEIRSRIDESNKTLNYKIRNAQIQHAPNMIIIGEKEEQNTASTRARKGKKENALKPGEFILRLKKETLERK
jgi:threonyl-tRNA synthetase